MPLLLCLTCATPSAAQGEPQVREPILIEAEKPNYNPDDMGTYAVYTDFHTVVNPTLTSSQPTLRKGISDCRNFCLWNNDSVTCLAYVTRNDWNREYYSFEPGSCLIDDATGKKYMLKRVRGLPVGRLFMAQSWAGTFVTFVLEFERIPDSANSVSYVDAPGKPFKAWDANWSGHTYPRLSVKALKANTPILKYVDVKVVR